jgi:TPR repeat protein
MLRGKGMPRNAVAAVELLQRAAGAGDYLGCLWLGEAHAEGLGGLPVNVAEARVLFERAAAGSETDVAARARRLLHTLPSSQAVVSKLPLSVAPACGFSGCGAALDAGTLSGLCASCRAVRFCGHACQRAGWPAHRAACQAATAARKASKAETTASSKAGASPSVKLLEQRAEVETWVRMPLDALRQAAESGTAAAQCVLGYAYMDGVYGVAKDEAAGLVWLRKAAAQGLLPPRVLLARAAYRAGASGAADDVAHISEGAEWARPAAEAGDIDAEVLMHATCTALAEVQGDSAPPSLWAESGHWLRRAAAHGSCESLHMLACHTWHGHPGMGVARDRAEACRLFAAADAAGLPEETRAHRPAGAPGSAQ